MTTSPNQPIATYQTACAYLDSFINYERTGFRRGFAEALRFNTIDALLDLLGQPQDSCATIHIAGTKGKGSVAAMMEAALRQAGYSTGLYTSPHLVTMRERIRVNGRKITRAELINATERLRQAVAELDSRSDLRRPTFFEIYTALGFMAFADAHVDVAIIETGLGGRLDATNIITPLASVITSVDFDHTEILGSELTQIAREKAGIIKSGVPVVSACQAREVGHIIATIAQQLGAPLIEPPALAEFGQVQPLAQPDSRDELVQPRQSFALALDSGPLWIETGLLGQHQAYNCAVAYGALATLADRGFVVSDDDFVQGLAKVEWPARLQIAEACPWLILDCAHNPASLRALVSALPRHLDYDRLTVVLGISAEKDAAQIVHILGPAADQIVVTAADNARALSVGGLRAAVEDHGGGPMQTAATVPEAVELGRRLTARSEALCVTGSFFVVGEAMAALGLEP